MMLHYLDETYFISFYYDDLRVALNVNKCYESYLSLFKLSFYIRHSVYNGIIV